MFDVSSDYCVDLGVIVYVGLYEEDVVFVVNVVVNFGGEGFSMFVMY